MFATGNVVVLDNGILTVLVERIPHWPNVAEAWVTLHGWVAHEHNIKLVYSGG